MKPPVLAESTITDLARASGIPLAAEDFAARIATGASAAIEAVRSVSLQALGDETLFDYEPSNFVATLESLAEPHTDGLDRTIAEPTDSDNRP